MSLITRNWVFKKRFALEREKLTLFSSYELELSNFLMHNGHWVASQVMLMVKNLPANIGRLRDAGLIPALGGSPGGWYGNPLQCSYLENPRHVGAWWAAVYWVAQSRMWLKQLSSSSRRYTLYLGFKIHLEVCKVVFYGFSKILFLVCVLSLYSD